MDTEPDSSLQTIPVMISKDLYSRVEIRVKSSNDEFKSVEEYITFILTEVVREEQDQPADNVYTIEQEEEIKNRLKNLGYI